MKSYPLTFVGAILCGSAALCAQNSPAKNASPTGEHPLVATLAAEIDYSVANLKGADGIKPYYLACTITDTTSLNLQARLGVVQASDQSRVRALDVDLRVGDHTLDNTRQIRGGRGGGRGFAGGATAVSLDDDPESIRHSLWRATNDAFSSAVERYQQVVTNSKTMVKEETPADDFSKEKPSVYSEPDTRLEIDKDLWTARIKSVSAMALQQPQIESSSVSIVGTAENRYMASNEGTRLKTGRKLLRVVVSASTKAEDGMEISQSFLFNAATEDHLPGEEEVRKAMKKVMDEVLALRAAPLVEPYTGPAILLNRASGVFFHEIFGHRIEGHRQKSEDEGQTFTKMVGQPVLPDFLSVIDDPTRMRFGTEDLRGYYKFDDEGMPAQKVELVKKGILQTFLLSRSPLAGFPASNGHGRREPGRDPVSRQGNLMVLSDRTMTFAQLRAQLIELCKKQGKPFGLLFEDITGGFTTTTRGGPQAFKVEPVVVYRIYADGRPDELVRGVDIVGTPLSCFSKIVATADDTAVFNGTCGAESGWVPVTATSPSILVEQIEIEKKQRSSARPPLLASPLQTPPKNSDENPALAKENAVYRALEDELARYKDLKLSDIAAPYYVEYRVTERQSHDVVASRGALVRSQPSKSRVLQTGVRVGSYDFDNSNFQSGGGPGAGFGGFGGGRRPGGAAGGAAALPIEEDYASVRQAAWLSTDAAYKNAVETLAQKNAYVEGRAKDAKETKLPDFAKAEPVKSTVPATPLELDTLAWEARLRKVSARFNTHKNLVDSGVELQTAAENDTYFTTEGTRERCGARRATLLMVAEQIADDGQRVSDRTVFVAESAAGLPSEEKLIAAVDELAARVAGIASGARLKEYSGPVLFDGIAAPQVFQTLLARGVAAQPAEVGGGRRRAGGEGMDKLMGKRVLPASFHVWDDPNTSRWNDTFLSGSYSFDDEGLAPKKVELVTAGKLVGLLASRTPTELTPESNGHGRGGRAMIGCLFVEASDGLPADALRARLIAAAKDQGLKYALRVSSLGGNAGGARGGAGRFGGGGRGGARRGGAAGGPGGAMGGGLPDPLVITRIFVDDGHEEPVRACEFDGVSVSSLKDILAAGNTPAVLNSPGALGTSVIAPAILMETVNLFGVEEESAKKPALPQPSAR